MKNLILSVFALVLSSLSTSLSQAANPATFDYSKLRLEKVEIRNSKKENLFPYELVDSEMRGYHPLEIRLKQQLEQASETVMQSRLYVAKDAGSKYDNIYVFVGRTLNDVYVFVRCYSVPDDQKTEDYGSFCSVERIADVMSWNMNIVNENKKYELIMRADKADIFEK